MKVFSKTIYLMKNLILFAMILFFWQGSIQAQGIPSSEVPEAVKNAFMKTHSNAKDIEWERKGEYYNVEYEIGRNNHELWISSEGQILRHKEDISSSDLPRRIKEKIKSDYRSYRIDDAEKLTAGNQVFYKIELEGRGNNSDLDLILDANGNSQDNKVWYQMPR
jgi:hypothetical protein